MKKQKTGLKKYLRRGDPAIIANMTGFSVRTIRGMLAGKRPLHPLVLAAIERLVEHRMKTIDEQLTQSN